MVTPQDELNALTLRLIRQIRERYDAMVEKLRRDARDMGKQAR